MCIRDRELEEEPLTQSFSVSASGSQGAESDNHFYFYTEQQSLVWALPRVARFRGEVARIGVDIGNVIFKVDLDGQQVQVEDAFQGVQCLVRHFGTNNVFLVSRVGRFGNAMHRSINHALLAGAGLKQLHVLKENVIFTMERAGEFGKGVVAMRVGISNFIDDQVDCLETVHDNVVGPPGKLWLFREDLSSHDARVKRCKHAFRVASWANIIAYYEPRC